MSHIVDCSLQYETVSSTVDFSRLDYSLQYESESHILYTVVDYSLLHYSGSVLYQPSELVLY